MASGDFAIVLDAITNVAAWLELACWTSLVARTRMRFSFRKIIASAVLESSADCFNVIESPATEKALSRDLYVVNMNVSGIPKCCTFFSKTA